MLRGGEKALKNILFRNNFVGSQSSVSGGVVSSPSPFLSCVPFA